MSNEFKSILTPGPIVEEILTFLTYAPFTVENGVITYGEPIPIPGAINLVLDPRGEMTEFYADNILYYSASNNQGYDGTLTIANIPEQFAIDALGEEKDSIDLVITEKANKIDLS